MVKIKILIITGQQSYSIIKKVIRSVKEHTINVYKAPISISAFLSENLTEEILKSFLLSEIDLVLIPGFCQWDTTNLERKLSISIRKGPEFASDLQSILKNLNKVELSNSIPANKLMELSGEKLFKKILKENLKKAKAGITTHTFYLNENISNIIIGRNLPPPIIAEIVNCTEKSDEKILKKVNYYINSGADIIDIGCVSNNPNPKRIEEIIDLIRNKFNVLLSIDSMDKNELLSAINKKIDLILSLDEGNYLEFLNIPKDIPIVLLPTNIEKGYFPKDPKIRVKNLLNLTREMQEHGFKKLIADPLLETPISPGICNSLEAYFLYKKEVARLENKSLELPLFFGVSNVVELMDIDSVGINGLLASIAIELDIGILFTVEHSTKLTGGVAELKECVKLNYVSKYNKTPPINQGIQIFKAKGKIHQEIPKISEKNVILVNNFDPNYIPDEMGYFKIYVDHFIKKIYVMLFSYEHKLLKTFIGTNAEALSKKIIDLNLTKNIRHLNYIGRELGKAEFCLLTGKPYIQDDS
ncbi:MAG: dihydropteroate synthase-like protein [Promethearchaeota archaeon]